MAMEEAAWRTSFPVSRASGEQTSLSPTRLSGTLAAQRLRGAGLTKKIQTGCSEVAPKPGHKEEDRQSWLVVDQVNDGNTSVRGIGRFKFVKESRGALAFECANHVTQGDGGRIADEHM